MWLKNVILLVLLCHTDLKAQTTLWYNDRVTLDAQKPLGTTKTINECTWSYPTYDYIDFWGDNTGVASIASSKYFSGSITITANYKYIYQGSNGQLKTEPGSLSWTISCGKIIVTLVESNIKMKVGENRELKYSIDKNHAAPISWESSSPKVVTVDRSGNITAVSSGTATITLNSGWGSSATCKVTVEDNKPTSIKIPPTLELRPGATEPLSPTILPSNAKYTLTWKSSNTNIATVSQDGWVRGISDGSTYITVTTDNNLSSSCYVSVIPYPTSISINEAQLSLKIGATKQLTYSLTPSNAQSNVTWQSSNPSAVSVSTAGRIEAKAKGTATITCTTENGKTASIEVSTFELRDVDGDGEICVADLSAIVKYIRGKGANANFNVKAADVNEDGKVDEEDLRIIEDIIINN